MVVTPDSAFLIGTVCVPWRLQQTSSLHFGTVDLISLQFFPEQIVRLHLGFESRSLQICARKPSYGYHDHLTTLLEIVRYLFAGVVLADIGARLTGLCSVALGLFRRPIAVREFVLVQNCKVISLEFRDY